VNLGQLLRSMLLPRSLPFIQQALQQTGLEAALPAAARCYSTLGNFSFSSAQDAPTSSLSGSIKLSATTKGKNVEASVGAGSASAKAKYSVEDLRKQATKHTQLAELARISTLHSSFVDYLLRLAAERYQVLAQWPDFSTAYGKDFYYRAHPEDLKKFYAAVDEFHAAYDTLTEFESLSGVAAQMLPGYQKRRQNVMGPTVGPTSANAAVTQFLLAHAK